MLQNRKCNFGNFSSQDPTTEDGGSYKCNAMNELGDSNANITLNLQGAAEPPKSGDGPTFTQKPKIVPKDGE